MNNKSFLVSIAMIIMAGCVSEDDALLKTRVPISLTTSIAPTRATQDVQIGDGQEVYIWANEEEVSGTTNWDANNYIEAWHLTANATGGLTSANTYYYPTRPLSMVAIHGNFEFDEGKTQFPGVVSHTILADQSTAANLMKSDLLWWKGSGITSAGNPGGIPVTFAHNLSKIEITLSSDFYTTDQLNAMEVSLCNVLPTVDLSLADGTTNAAHGTRITVTPLKPSASSPTFEAVIPAQARPDNFIVVRLDGGVVNVDAQVSEFDANTRYPYNLDITYRDVRKNPLWYVAEYNVNYDYSATEIANSNTYDGSGSYSWTTTVNEGFYFSWVDALTAASKFDGWHLPTLKEGLSILPALDGSLWGLDSSESGTYKATTDTECFGYNQTTADGINEAAYWKKISSSEIHGLRFLGTDYCSAWKYVWNNDVLTIYATLVGNIEDNSSDAAAWYTANWNNVYFGNNESIGAVMRSISAPGYNNTGSNATYNTLSQWLYLWTSTQKNDVDAYVFWATEGNAKVGCVNDRKTYGRRIRLFKNGNVYKNLSDVTTDDVGKVICTNGHIHYTTRVVTCGGTPSAMIAYVGNQNGNSGTSAYSSTFNHGLAVALTEVANTSGDEATSLITINWANSATAASAYVRPRPSNTSPWFQGSVYQWERILIGCGSTSSFIDNEVNFSTAANSFSYGQFRILMNNCGGIIPYHRTWTTTESSSNPTWVAYYYDFAESRFLGNNKATGFYVRSILAF